jgi:hypothetical protein
MRTTRAARYLGLMSKPTGDMKLLLRDRFNQISATEKQGSRETTIGTNIAIACHWSFSVKIR